MRDVTDRFLYAVQGSNRPIVVADIWREGEIVRENVKPATGAVKFDAANPVEAQLTGFSFVDDDPNAEPIDANGCRVHIRAGFHLADDEELVSMGWYPIDQVRVLEAWEWAQWSAEPFPTSRVTTAEALDWIEVVRKSEFLAPVQPTVGADAWQTITDLCAGVVSVVDPGFAPRTIPDTDIVFSWSRLDAIKAIARLWDAYPVMTPNEQLTLATDDSGDVVPGFAPKVNIEQWEKESNSRDLVNGVTVIGRTKEGHELLGYATEDSGPLRWGGPFGRRPFQFRDDLMDTQAKVDAAARTRLQTEINRRASYQTVSALWNPALELRDRAPLNLPGERATEAMIAGYTLPLLGGPMDVKLRLPWRG